MTFTSLLSHFQVSTRLSYLERVLEEKIRSHAASQQQQQQQAAAAAAAAASGSGGAGAASAFVPRPPPILASGIRVVRLLLGTGTPQALAGAGGQVKEGQEGGGS